MTLSTKGNCPWFLRSNQALKGGGEMRTWHGFGYFLFASQLKAQASFQPICHSSWGSTTILVSGLTPVGEVASSSTILRILLGGYLYRREANLAAFLVPITHLPVLLAGLLLCYLFYQHASWSHNQKMRGGIGCVPLSIPSANF